MRCYFQLEVNIRTSEFRPQINMKEDQKEATPLVSRCRCRPGLKPTLQDEQVRSHHLQGACTQAGELINVQQLGLRLLIHSSQCRRNTKNKYARNTHGVTGRHGAREENERGLMARWLPEGRSTPHTLIHTHTHTHTTHTHHTNLYMHTYTHTHPHTHMCIFIYTPHTHTYTHTTHTYIRTHNTHTHHIRIYTFIYTYTHTYPYTTHAYTHVCSTQHPLHIHTHTYTHHMHTIHKNTHIHRVALFSIEVAIHWSMTLTSNQDWISWVSKDIYSIWGQCCNMRKMPSYVI